MKCIHINKLSGLLKIEITKQSSTKVKLALK